jgi:hypothetical protein
MLDTHHGMLNLVGMGLVANLGGICIFISAAIGLLFSARRPSFLKFWLTVAAIGVAVVICGTGVVIASE